MFLHFNVWTLHFLGNGTALLNRFVLSHADSEDEEDNSDNSSSDPDDTTSKSTVVAVPISTLEEDEPEMPELKSLFGLHSCSLTDQPPAIARGVNFC